MKDEIEKILHGYTVTRDTIKRKKYIEGITYNEQPAYKENHNETIDKILQLFQTKIDSCTHEVYLAMISDGVSAKDIINIIKQKIKEK